MVEAQACGKPVLAGASGGTAETMLPGETGLVVPCDEPAPLADAVADLLLDEPRRLRMGQAARKWAVENFDWSSLARQAAGLLGMAVEEAAGPLIRETPGPTGTPVSTASE